MASISADCSGLRWFFQSPTSPLRMKSVELGRSYGFNSDILAVSSFFMVSKSVRAAILAMTSLAYERGYLRDSCWKILLHVLVFHE